MIEQTHRSRTTTRLFLGGLFLGRLLPCRLILGAITLGAGLLAFSLASPVAAQTGVRGANTSDRIERLLFSPELVMRHQADLELTREQKEILVREMQQAQSDLVPLQLDMAEIGGDLAKLLSQSRVDEAAAVAAAGRVMDLESRIKSRHLVLLLRIRNMLTREQQTMLRRLRRRQWEQRRNGGER